MSSSSGMLTLVCLVALLVQSVHAFAFTSSPVTQVHANANARQLPSRSSRSSSPGTGTTTVMMAGKNRRERRYADGKKNKGGSKGATRQPSTSDAKWLQVLDKAPEMEPGSVKVVSGKYKGEDKFFTLASHGGNVFAVGEACGRCKFPMINGKVKVLLGEGKAEDVKAGVEEDPDADVAIACPLCGAMFDMRTGKIAGEQPKGLAQMLVSKVVSQTPVESITTYPAQSLSTGAIVVRVD